MMNRQNGDDFCDLVRNFTGSLEGIINKQDRNKTSKAEMIDKLIKKTSTFEDKLWMMRGKRDHPNQR